MKKIIAGEELQNNMETAIQLLCGTVKQTLGPKGNNVIIDSSNFSPFITNDGVTIAQNIESDDEGVRTILDLAREASIKTNEVVGDGTTTTLVLLESLFMNSLTYIKEGIHPILLKQELNEALQEIIKYLTSLKRKATKKMIQNIATISANDEKIGDLVSEAFQIVKDKSAIIVEENEEGKMSLSQFQGYYFSTTLPSSYFMKNQTELIFHDAYLLISHKEFVSIEDIELILNEVMEQNQSLVIIAERFDENLVQTLTSFSLDGKLNCCLLTLEEYGLNEQIVKRDLEVIADAKKANDFSIGYVSHIVIQPHFTRIDFQENENIQKYVGQIKKELLEKKEDFQKDFYDKRLAMFNHGIVKINIGSATKTECREKRMRLDDAICAVSASQNGVLPGGGISFLKISNQLNDNSIGNLIWKQALKKPLEQILMNAGLDTQTIIKKIEQDNWNILYNITKNQFESCSKTTVVDPYDVILYSLQHACSIATMLLTTTSLVINEKKDLNIEQNYFES